MSLKDRITPPEFSLPFIPTTTTSGPQIDSVSEQGKCFGCQFESNLPGLRWLWPEKSSLIQALRRNPKPGSIEIEQLNTVAPFIDENKECVTTESIVFYVLAGERKKPIEAFAHVTGIERNEYLEGSGSESNHR